MVCPNSKIDTSRIGDYMRFDRERYKPEMRRNIRKKSAEMEIISTPIVEAMKESIEFYPKSYVDYAEPTIGGPMIRHDGFVLPYVGGKDVFMAVGPKEVSLFLFRVKDKADYFKVRRFQDGAKIFSEFRHENKTPVKTSKWPSILKRYGLDDIDETRWTAHLIGQYYNGVEPLHSVRPGDAYMIYSVSLDLTPEETKAVEKYLDLPSLAANPYPEKLSEEETAYFKQATKEGMPEDYYDDEMVTTMIFEGFIKPDASFKQDMDMGDIPYDNVELFNDTFRDSLPIDYDRSWSEEFRMRCLEWAKGLFDKYTNYQVEDLIFDKAYETDDWDNAFTSHGFAWKLTPKHTPAPKKRKYTSMFNIIARNPSLMSKDCTYCGEEGHAICPKCTEFEQGEVCVACCREPKNRIHQSSWPAHCSGCAAAQPAFCICDDVERNPYDGDDFNPEQDMLNQMIAKEYDLDDHEAAITQDMGRMMEADILGITFDDEYEVEIRYDNGSKAEFEFGSRLEAVRYFANMAVANHIGVDFLDADDSDKKLAEAVFALWSEISPKDHRVVSVRAEAV